MKIQYNNQVKKYSIKNFHMFMSYMKEMKQGIFIWENKVFFVQIETKVELQEYVYMHY